MDVEAVYAAAQKAVAHIRAGKGPYILEMLTYRYRGHSMSDPAKYRKREEVDKVRDETDPIKLLEARLVERGILDEADAKSQRNEIKEEIEQAVDFALDAALPPESELMVDILADGSHIEGGQNGR
jgi:pyruvate dehydrogenase E1 component alpha subunit